MRSLIKKEFLLEQLNKKIQILNLDTNTFINQNNEDLFIADFGHESDKNFINYVINFFKSTFKITKFQANIENESQISPDINLIIESIKSAKEYLIFGDLKKSIIKIKRIKTRRLHFGYVDFRCRKKLDQAKENLNNLESTPTFHYRKKKLIKVIKLFIIILILTSVVVWLSDNPGKVEIILNNYLIQTNMIGISLILVSIVFFTIIIFVIFGTIKNFFQKNFKLNRKAKYLKLANESLDNLAANILLGNSDNIEKDARKLTEIFR